MRANDIQTCRNCPEDNTLCNAPLLRTHTQTQRITFTRKEYTRDIRIRIAGCLHAGKDHALHFAPMLRACPQQVPHPSPCQRCHGNLPLRHTDVSTVVCDKPRAGHCGVDHNLAACRPHNIVVGRRGERVRNAVEA